MEELWFSWGELVRKRCESQGVSLRELARQTSVSQSAVQHIVRGKVSPRDRTRIEIAKALGTTVNDLFPYPVEGDTDGATVHG